MRASRLRYEYRHVLVPLLGVFALVSALADTTLGQPADRVPYGVEWFVPAAPIQAGLDTGRVVVRVDNHTARPVRVEQPVRVLVEYRERLPDIPAEDQVPKAEAGRVQPDDMVLTLLVTVCTTQGEHPFPEGSPGKVSYVTVGPQESQTLTVPLRPVPPGAVIVRLQALSGDGMALRTDWAKLQVQETAEWKRMVAEMRIPAVIQSGNAPAR